MAAGKEQSWAGQWKSSDDGGHGGELKCVARQVAGRRWQAVFSGYCNKEFVYHVKMKGRQEGEKIVFTGAADLGEEEGKYEWTGELAEGQFTGKYHCASGKKGGFEMKRVVASSGNEKPSAGR